MADIIGTSFPFEVDSEGRVKEIYNADVVKQSLKIILNTYEYERFYYPHFGVALNRFAFESLNYTTLKQIEFEAKTSIEKWEKRIDYLEVSASISDEEYAAVILDVVYKIGGLETEFHYLHTLNTG